MCVYAAHVCLVMTEVRQVYQLLFSVVVCYQMCARNKTFVHFRSSQWSLLLSYCSRLKFVVFSLNCLQDQIISIHGYCQEYQWAQQKHGSLLLLKFSYYHLFLSFYIQISSFSFYIYIIYSFLIFCFDEVLFCILKCTIWKFIDK